MFERSHFGTSLGICLLELRGTIAMSDNAASKACQSNQALLDLEASLQDDPVFARCLQDPLSPVSPEAETVVETLVIDVPCSPEPVGRPEVETVAMSPVSEASDPLEMAPVTPPMSPVSEASDLLEMPPVTPPMLLGPAAAAAPSAAPRTPPNPPRHAVAQLPAGPRQPPTPPWRLPAVATSGFSASDGVGTGTVSSGSGTVSGVSSGSGGFSAGSGTARGVSSGSGGGHEWAVAPEARRRSNNLSQADVLRLRQEAAAAKACGIPWQERGPVGPEDGGPTHWRGQQWRSGANNGQARWGNRGGKYREYYATMARMGMVGFVKGGDKGKGGKGGGNSGTATDDDGGGTAAGGKGGGNSGNTGGGKSSGTASSSWSPY